MLTIIKICYTPSTMLVHTGLQIYTLMYNICIAINNIVNISTVTIVDDDCKLAWDLHLNFHIF